MSNAAVTLQYSSKSHNFTLKAEKVQEVKYTLRYSAKGKSVENAFTGKGKATSNGIYAAEHLAGTESSGSKVLHDVTGGVLEVNVKDTLGQEAKYIQHFTVDSKGTLLVTNSSEETAAPGSVQGASTNSDMLSGDSPQVMYETPAPAMPEDEFNQIASPRAVATPAGDPFTNSDTMESTATPASDGMLMSTVKNLGLPVAVIAITLVSVALIARRLRAQ